MDIVDQDIQLKFYRVCIFSNQEIRPGLYYEWILYRGDVHLRLYTIYILKTSRSALGSIINGYCRPGYTV